MNKQMPRSFLFGCHANEIEGFFEISFCKETLFPKVSFLVMNKTFEEASGSG
jgi:hypothetical protein